MEQTGYVVELTENGAKVRVDRESACGGNCVSCKGCPSSAVIVECSLAEKVEAGDMVKLTMQNSKFFKNAALGYGLLVILMILGAVVGYCTYKSEGASVLGAAIGIAIGLVTLKFAFRNRKGEIVATKIKTEE